MIDQKEVIQKVEQYLDNMDKNPEEMDTEMDKLVIYLEGLIDNESNPLVATDLSQVTTSIMIFKLIVTLVKKIKIRFGEVNSKLNNFEDRINKLERKSLDNPGKLI